MARAGEFHEVFTCQDLLYGSGTGVTTMSSSNPNISVQTLEQLLAALYQEDGLFIHAKLATLAFDDQLEVGRRLQSMAAKARFVDENRPPIYCHFTMNGSLFLSERLTLRLIEGTLEKDIYSVQHQIDTGKLLIYYRTKTPAKQPDFCAVEVKAGMLNQARIGI